MDYVVANMYLHHFEHPAQAIAEAVRILRPGGSLAITDLEAHNYDFLRAEHRDRWLGFEYQAMTDWMSQAGLEAIVVEPVGSTCQATSETGGVNASVGIFLATGQKRQLTAS